MNEKNSQPNEKKNYSLLYTKLFIQYPWTQQMHPEHNWTTIKQKKKNKMDMFEVNHESMGKPKNHKTEY